MNRIVVVDYGMGNLRSVAQALRAAAPDADVQISSEVAAIKQADRVVLPGLKGEGEGRGALEKEAASIRGVLNDAYLGGTAATAPHPNGLGSGACSTHAQCPIRAPCGPRTRWPRACRWGRTPCIGRALCGHGSPASTHCCPPARPPTANAARGNSVSPRPLRCR